jgi:nitrite reductase/ring-hydroxylating ferredoxin subunit
MTAVDEGRIGHVGPTDPELTKRALGHVRAGTTDLAPAVLKVPLSYYGDEELLRRETDLLMRTPIAVVASARVREAHDFVVREVLGTSVLVSRGSDGVVRAFLNYCRHRGARPAEGCGQARRFSCPYHGWVYDSEGGLVGIPGQRGFTGVHRSDTGLVALPCEERHGLVWVVLTAKAPLDLDAHLGPLDAELGGWQLSDYEHLTYRDLETEVSYKAALEAFAESYHFPYVHANSLIGQNTIADVAVHEAFGRHHRICFPFPWITNLDEGEASWEPVDNVAIIYWVYPNLVLAFTSVGVELIDILPAGAPTRCTVRHGWMARFPATTDEERAGYSDLFELVHAALRDEDCAVLRLCGDGIRNGQHGHMLIGRNEIGVQHVVRTFAGALGIEFMLGGA